LSEITISIDAMGGDSGPSVTVPAAIMLLKHHPRVKLILVGNQAVLNTKIAAEDPKLLNRIVVQHASEEVLMDELPSKALRSKKDSSMRVAINLVKNGTAQACVSAGNTGALMATARFVLKTLPGIDRPAITTSFPTMIPGKTSHVLDLGANVDSEADYLYQFALMGSVLASVVDNIERPKVALLNIGSEENKGNEQIKKAAHILAEDKNINYVGFIESNDIFKGTVDIIVCDGFIGNIMLKSIEGVMKLIKFYIVSFYSNKKNIFSSIAAKLLALLAMPMLMKLYKYTDPGKYNGATLIGLRGIVIKSHGSANIVAFYHALEKAVLEAEKQVPQRIHDKLAKILEQSKTI
jgi:phosphate acyltransferase